MTRSARTILALSAALALATGCQALDDDDGAASQVDAGHHEAPEGPDGPSYAADAGSWEPSGAGGAGGAGGGMGAGAEAPPVPEDQFYPGEDQFEDVGDNPWVDTAEDALSTFSVDTDTASYTLARRSLLAGALPEPASVRVEEFINYFQYDYPAPAPDAEVPFRVDLEAAPSPFGAGKHLLRIGLKGKLPDQRKPANLVFLVDVSGSMRSRLPLVKTTLNQLVDALRPDDTIAIVTYAGQDRVALPPTPVADRAVILDAVYDMQAGGGTNGADGLRTAYLLAEEHQRVGGINRVVLCTDGDF
ncbi:MAG: von Willebrand factor type A domain-containing protein, partial [Myxococcales bacterium]|nr:von Willebrand factor type A domain-containing protein [Myxococcales bacterium]